MLPPWGVGSSKEICPHPSSLPSQFSILFCLTIFYTTFPPHFPLFLYPVSLGCSPESPIRHPEVLSLHLPLRVQIPLLSIWLGAALTSYAISPRTWHSPGQGPSPTYMSLWSKAWPVCSCYLGLNADSATHEVCLGNLLNISEDQFSFSKWGCCENETR